MLLINTVIEGDNIIASADGFPEQVTIPLSPRYFHLPQTYKCNSPNFLSTLQTTPTIDLFGTDIRPRILPDHSSFFANFLNVSTCKLVYLGPDPRPTIINQAPPSAQGGRLVTTTFADCAPYLLLSQESFDDLQEHLPADGKLEGVTRFRPNIVVKGVDQAYDEDGWKEIEVGSVGKIYCVARMPRCQLPKCPSPAPHSDCSVNPATGVKDLNQPYKTMTKYRRIDPGAKYHPCLGMCAVTDKIGILLDCF